MPTDCTPTPEDIRRCCLEIQQGWTEAEEFRRRSGSGAGSTDTRNWLPPGCADGSRGVRLLGLADGLRG